MKIVTSEKSLAENYVIDLLKLKKERQCVLILSAEILSNFIRVIVLKHLIKSIIMKYFIRSRFTNIF